MKIFYFLSLLCLISSCAIFSKKVDSNLGSANENFCYEQTTGQLRSPSNVNQCVDLFASNTTQNKPTEVKDLKSFGQAMTEGLLLNPNQADLFEIYRKIFFGDPNTSVGNETLKSVTEQLRQHPELEKPHFREYEISSVQKVYDTTESLQKYLKSQFTTAGEVRNNLFQIEANLGFWKKVFDYTDPELPQNIIDMQKKLNKDSAQSEKDAYRKAKSEFEIDSKKRFETYLTRMISKANRDLLKDLKNDKEDYNKKAKALFQTLKYIQEWMDKKGRNTQPIRQAMVDLVHTIGFGNQATHVLLKSKNGLDKIEGLKKVLDERDAMAMDLGYAGHFQELQQKLKIDFPTGLSKNENASVNLQKLEQEILKGKFTTKPTETVRVRSLSIQEAPFRSCLGGSDCSTRTYFSKALDPNFNYFTMTDGQNNSSGHVTVVLGEALNPQTQKLEKVAFIDKLQNVPNQQIPHFLQAVSQSLAEKGYKLGVPEDVGDHNGMSNMDTTRHFVANEVNPKLSQKLNSFMPHANQYNFKNTYSRAYNKLNLKIFEPTQILDANTEIKPGREYKKFTAVADLDKNKLIQDLLNLKKSDDPNDVLKYVSSGQVVAQLEKLGLFSVKDFEKDLNQIIAKIELPFNVRKQAAIEILLLNVEKNELNFDFKYFAENEKTQFSSEIKQWSKSSDKRKKKFADNLDQQKQKVLESDEPSKLKALFDLKLADLNERNISGFSLLLEAIYNQSQKIIDSIIADKNYDFTKKDQHGYTDVERLRLFGKSDLADLIEKKRPEAKSNKKIVIKERNDDGTPIIDSVRVEPGTFKMGEVGKEITVTLSKAFEVMSVDTTQKMWKGVSDLADMYLKNKYQINKDPSNYKGENRPVEQVSHYDITKNWLPAINELSKINNLDLQKKLTELFPGHYKGKVYRLLTEAEYEYLAKQSGLTNGKYTHGPNENNITDHAVFNQNSGNKTAEVGTKKPIFVNGKAVYDIIGNVWKWVQDSWDGNTALTGGLNPLSTTGSFRVIRGGGFNYGADDLRSGLRGWFWPDYRINYLGFRLASDIP